MKPFDYYNTIPVEYPSRVAISVALTNKIDGTPMTKEQREAAYADAVVEVDEIFKAKLAEYRKAEAILRDQFFEDCREELGYDDFLTEEGCKLLENMAWEESHHAGFSEIYWELCDLVPNVQKLIQHSKK